MLECNRLLCTHTPCSSVKPHVIAHVNVPFSTLLYSMLVVVLCVTTILHVPHKINHVTTVVVCTLQWGNLPLYFCELLIGSSSLAEVYCQGWAMYGLRFTYVPMEGEVNTPPLNELLVC